MSPLDANIAEAQRAAQEAKSHRAAEVAQDRILAEQLHELAHDMRLRQAIVITAVLRGGPLQITHRDVFDSAAHNLHIERTQAGYSVTLAPIN